MSKFNVEEFLDAVEDMESIEAVDEAFKAVFALPEKERESAAEALDKEFSLAMEEDNLDDIHATGVRATKHAIRKEIKSDLKDEFAEYIAKTFREVQVATRVVLNIKELRGDDASPLVSAFAAAAKKLTPRERDSAACIIKPLNAVINVLAEREGITVPQPPRRGAKNAKI